jgi:hypothetical protein
MSEDEAAQMGSAVENIPASADEVSTDAGEPPTLALEGDADPAQMGEQREAVDQKVSAEHAKAAGETSIPMGEGEIAPQASNETVTAESSGGAGGAAGGAGGGEATPDEETASIVAQEEKQGELDAAADKGAEDMAAEEEQHAEETETEKQRTMEEAERADEQAASDQQAEKSAAQRYVAKKRGQWRDEQTAAVETSQKDALKEETDTSGEIETERAHADSSAKEHIESGERDAKKEKGKKESEAEAEKAKAKNESSGFFGWLARKAKAFFNKIKAAIKSIMKALRDVVKGIIDRVKKAALAVIEAARKIAVAAIRAAGDAIIAIGDVALAAFPEAREKFRGYINEKVADAEDAVNQVADALKAGVEALFDALGEFLDKALQFLEKAMLAAVDAVAKQVDTIIKAAEAIAKAFGLFFTLIKDVASGPGAWISNLGAAAVDGIKNHLVKAMKDAISAWFKGKVEEVLGLPIDVMKTLFKGGISLDAIATMAWSALKSAIPPALIQLLIEKVVSMIVPAAGAVMAIIEGLQAAWGTVSKIIAAIDKFIAFLKAVKGGGAGPQFATAVAAGAVAVIDFVANWLLLRLMKPAKKVAGKIAAMAKKILAKIKKALKKVGKKLKRAWKKAKGFVKKKFGKKGKKGKGKDKKGKEKDKKAEKDKAAQKKLKKADMAIRRALRKATPIAKAQATIRRIAAQHGVRADISRSKQGLNVTLKVNPSLSEFFGHDDVGGAQQTIKTMKVRANDVGDALDKAINALRREGATGTKQELTQEVLKKEGGLEGFIGNRDLPSRSAKGDNQGQVHQDAVNAALAKKAEASDDLVHLGGGMGKGSDALVINTTTGEVTNYEIKGKGVPNMTEMPSGRAIPQKGSVPFQPMPGTEGSTTGQRHLGIGPGGAIANPTETARRADEIAGKPNEKGKTLQSPDGGGVENKLSSISENLLDNLRARAAQLDASIATAKSKVTGLKGEDKTKAKNAITKNEKALAILRDIISGVAGKLRLVVAPAPSPNRQKEPTARYVAEAMTLLEAGKRKYLGSVKEAGVAVETAVVELDDNGNEVRTLS